MRVPLHIRIYVWTVDTSAHELFNDPVPIALFHFSQHPYVSHTRCRFLCSSSGYMLATAEVSEKETKNSPDLFRTENHIFLKTARMRERKRPLHMNKGITECGVVFLYVIVICMNCMIVC